MALALRDILASCLLISRMYIMARIRMFSAVVTARGRASLSTAALSFRLLICTSLASHPSTTTGIGSGMFLRDAMRD